MTSDTPAAADLQDEILHPDPRTLNGRPVSGPDFGGPLFATRADVLDVQANVLDAVAVIEAKLDSLNELVAALISSAEQASTMAATVMQGGLGALLRGQKS